MMNIHRLFNPRTFVGTSVFLGVFATMTLMTPRGALAADACCPEGHGAEAASGAHDAHSAHGPNCPHTKDASAKLSQVSLESTGGKGPISLGGKVTNATTGAPVSGAAVQLVRPDMKKSMEEKVVETTRSTRDGRFRFAHKPGKSDQLLMVRAEWQGYPYVAVAYLNSQHASALDLKFDPANLELPVYNVSRSDPGVRFQAHHVTIENKPEGIDCTERIMLQNPSRSTYIGEGKDNLTLRLNLPAAAQRVKLSPEAGPARLVKDSTGYRVAMIIPPSAYQNRNSIEVTYHVPWSGMPWARSTDLSRKIGYPTNFFFVTRTEADKALKVSGAGLSADEATPLPMGEQTETRIVNTAKPTASDPATSKSTAANPHGNQTLKPGTDLAILVGRPTNPLFWGFLGFMVAMCALVPLVLRQPQSVKNAAATIGADVKTVPVARPELLAQQIADLDERMESGAVTPEEYEKQRSLWKQELAQLLKQAKQGA